MIVLDTNVISEIMRPKPELGVLRWLDGQPSLSIWTTAISIYEIYFGLQSMQVGKKQAALKAGFERWLAEVVEGRVLPFDTEAARQTAILAASRKLSGRPVDARDTMIAGIVLAARAKLATRNEKHFEEIAGSVVNPWHFGGSC